MAVIFAPVPAVELSPEAREALSRVEVYSRKGAIPPTKVTRQQFIEDILASGFLELKRSHNSHDGRVVAVSVSRGEGKERQFYTLNRKYEIEYLLLRHTAIMSVHAAKQAEAAKNIIDPTGHGWRYGETVSQAYTAIDGQVYAVTGTIAINSRQRWQVKLTSTGGAPGLRAGLTIPVTGSWHRQVTPEAEIPVSVVAPAVVAAVGPAVAIPVTPALIAPETKAVVADPPTASGPAVGAEVFLLTAAPTPGRVVGRLVRVQVPGQKDGEMRVRITHTLGAAGQAFPRGSTRLYTDQWQATTPELGASAPLPDMAQSKAVAETPDPVYQISEPKAPTTGDLRDTLKIALAAFNQVPNRRLNREYPDTYAVAARIEKVLGMVAETKDSAKASLELIEVAKGAEDALNTIEEQSLKNVDEKNAFTSTYQIAARFGRVLNAAEEPIMRDILREALLDNPSIQAALGRDQIAEARGLMIADIPGVIASLWATVSRWYPPLSGAPSWADQLGVLQALANKDTAALADAFLGRWQQETKQSKDDRASVAVTEQNETALAPQETVESAPSWRPAKPTQAMLFDGVGSQFIPVVAEILSPLPTLPDFHFALIADGDQTRTNWVAVIELSTGRKVVAEATAAEAVASLERIVAEKTPAAFRDMLYEQIASWGHVPDWAPNAIAAEPQMRSYKGEVSTDGGRSFAANSRRFATQAEAHRHLLELSGRWKAITDMRVGPAPEAVNAIADEYGAVSDLPAVQTPSPLASAPDASVPDAASEARAAFIGELTGYKGAASYGGTTYRVVPAPSAPDRIAAEQAHFVVEMRVGSPSRSIFSPVAMTMAQARARATATAFADRWISGPEEKATTPGLQAFLDTQDGDLATAKAAVGFEEVNGVRTYYAAFADGSPIVNPLRSITDGEKQHRNFDDSDSALRAAENFVDLMAEMQDLEKVVAELAVEKARQAQTVPVQVQPAPAPTLAPARAEREAWQMTKAEAAAERSRVERILTEAAKFAPSELIHEKSVATTMLAMAQGNVRSLTPKVDFFRGIGADSVPNDRQKKRLADAQTRLERAQAKLDDCTARVEAGKRAEAEYVLAQLPRYFEARPDAPYYVGTQVQGDLMHEHAHQSAVRRAILADKDVPAAVMDDFPDLQSLAKVAEQTAPWHFTFANFEHHCRFPFHVGNTEFRPLSFMARIDGRDVSSKELIQALEEARSAEVRSFGAETEADRKKAATKAYQAAVTNFTEAAFAHHQAAVERAVAAGLPVPEKARSEFDAILNAQALDVPHANPLVEKYAQRLYADAQAREIERLAANPVIDWQPRLWRLANDRGSLGVFRTLMAEHLAEIEGRKPEFVRWLNSNNPRTMDLLYEATGWVDHRKTEKNARACLDAWLGTGVVSAFETHEEAVAQAARDQRHAENELNNAIASLKATRNRYVPEGQTVPVVLDGVAFIDQLIAEGMRAIAVTSRGPLGGWVFSNPVTKRGLVLKNKVQVIYAQHALNQLTAGINTAAAVVPPVPVTVPTPAAPAVEKQVVAPASPFGPGGVSAIVLPVGAAAPAAIAAAAQQAANAQAAKKAEEAEQVEQEHIEQQAEVTAIERRQADEALVTEANASQPTPPSDLDALAGPEAAIAESSLVSALAAGAALASAAVPALSLVDWHTAGGQGDVTATRMIVQSVSGDNIIAFPADEFTSGEPVAAIAVPLTAVTVPADKPLFTRAPGVFRGWLAKLAADTMQSVPPEDLLGERLSALAQAATRGLDADAAAILREPTVALAIGEPAALIALEAEHVALIAKPKELAPEDRNFYFARDEQVAPRTLGARCKANIAAVRLLADVRENNRRTTPEEKAVLAGFSGWGSMKGIFNDVAAKRFQTITEHHARTNGVIKWVEYTAGDNTEVAFEDFVRYSGPNGATGKVKTATLLNLEDYVAKIADLADKARSGSEQYEFLSDAEAKQGYSSSYGEYSNSLRAAAMHDVLSFAKNWAGLREVLQKNLTEEEFQYAAVSSLNAHYTGEEICHRLWDIAQKAGFAGGVVLESAIGSGRVISAMPPELRDRCNVVGVEKDMFTAALAAAILPEVKVWPEPFEHAPVKPNSVDLVITNVPFDSMTIGDSGLNLHNFFIAEGMSKLKPGGLAVVITTCNTLDKQSEQRAKLADCAQLFDAFRLPTEAFKGTAGTDVVTDILVLRKPAQDLAPSTEIFRATLPVAVPVDQLPKVPKEVLEKDRDFVQPTSALINEFFTRHPDRALGTHSLLGKMYGAGNPLDPQYTMVSPEGALPLIDRLDAAIATMRPIPNCTTPVQYLSESEREERQLAALKEDAIGSIVLREGKVWRVAEYRELLPLAPDPKAGLNEEQTQQALSAAETYVRMRDAFRELIAADLNPVTTDEQSAAKRSELKAVYDEYREAFGAINEDRGRRLLHAVCGTDPHYYSVCALENVSEERKNKRKVKVCVPSKILVQRTLFPSRLPTKADNLEDAANISMAEKTRIDEGYISRLLGRDPSEGTAKIREELVAAGIAFIDPVRGEAVHRNHYLSGDVYSKLERAKAMGKIDPTYQRNIEALIQAQPRAIPFEELRFSLSSAWLPPIAVTTFMRTVGLDNSDIMVYDDKIGWRPNKATGGEERWKQFFNSYNSSQARANYSVEAIPFDVVFRGALSGRIEPVRREVGGKYIIDEVLTRAVEDKAKDLATAFRTWLTQDDQAEMREQLVVAYNSSFNRVVQSVWDGAKLRLPGLSHYVPMKHQRDAVQRNLSRKRGLVGHGVGFGKTLEIIVTAYEMKRMGMVNKPLIVCDSANYEQIVAEAHKCYPAARILHGDEGSMSPANREGFKSLIATGDYDMILVSREQFKLLRVSPEREAAALSRELESAEAALGGEASGKARAQAKRKAKILQRALDKLKDLREKGTGLTFEECGIDFLLVDESHRHKKIGFETRFEMKGIDTGASERGRDLKLKANYLQDLHGSGRGAIGFTGTPVSNTNAELHTAAALFDPETLKEFSVVTFDQFLTTFCDTTNELELNEANGRWRYVERLAKFKNFREFQSFIATFSDIRLDPTELGIKRPDHEKGGIELATCPLSHPAWVGQQLIGDIYETWENLIEDAKGGGEEAQKEAFKEKMEMAWITLALMGLNTALAIDPRLVDPNAKVGKEALIYGVADEIAKIYKEKNQSKAAGELTHTQVVFCDRIQSGADRMFELDLSGKGPSGAQLYAMGREKFVIRHGLEEDAGPRAKSQNEEDDEEELADNEPLTARVKADLAGACGKAVKGGLDKIERFNLWEELRDALVERGVPRDQVALISDAKNKAARKELYDRMNSGELAVLIGSRDRMGVGANFQNRLYALHNVDPARSMTPDSQEQAHGRILRQGNSHPAIRIICYGMSDTVIPAQYGRINYKGAMARQAYAKPGDELEFAESKDLGAEALRASLLTDTRARDLALMSTEVRELKVQIDAEASKLDTLRRRIQSSNTNLTYHEGTLARLSTMAAWFEKNVATPQGAPEWSLRIKPRTVTPWDEAIARKAELSFVAGELVLQGPPEKVRPILAKFIDGWREDETARTVAQVVWNGIEMTVKSERFYNRSSDGSHWALSSDVMDPIDKFDAAKPGENTGLRRVYHSFEFRTDSSFESGVVDMLRNAGNLVKTEAATVEYHKSELEANKEAYALGAKVDVSANRKRIEELGVTANALKKDMQDRPFAGKLPKPSKSGAKCELTYSVPSLEVKKEAKVGMAARAQQQVVTVAAPVRGEMAGSIGGVGRGGAGRR